MFAENASTDSPCAAVGALHGCSPRAVGQLKEAWGRDVVAGGRDRSSVLCGDSGSKHGPTKPTRGEFPPKGDPPAARPVRC